MAQAGSHVPAWKRLGLKLKYANEQVLDSSPQTVKADETNGISKPKSKSKKSDLNGHSSPPAPTTNGSVAQALLYGHREDGPPPAKKQKRVSFSPDTKLLDGDGEGASTARHAVPSELANGGPPPPPPSSSTANTGRTSSTSKNNTNNNKTKPDPAAATTAAAAASKPKPAKKSKPSQTPPSKHKSQNMLDYLHLYYNEHASWKFQKNREVWILKHALSTEDISTKEYGLALAQYVYGLKGEAARKRLAEEAEAKLLLEMEEAAEAAEEETRTKGEEEAEQLKKLKDMLTAFPKASHQQQQQETNVLAALSRPLLILAALYPDRDRYRPASRRAGAGAGTQNGGDSSKPAAAAAAAIAAETVKSKKKKNRTVVVEYSSSSESESSSDSDGDGDSSSSSGSDSESDDDNGQNGNGNDDDETSSSGEDSSSSSDDSS